MVSDVYFPRVNGVSTSIETFRRELVARGHEVTLVAPDYGREQEDDQGVWRIPSRTVVLDSEDRMMRHAGLRAAEAHLARRSYDIVHIQTPFVAHYAGLRMGRRLRLPVVESYHTFFEEYLYHYVRFLPRAWMRGMARHFSRRQCNSVDALVVPSTSMLDVLRRYGVRTPAQVIPTGIDLRGFDASAGGGFRDRHGIPPERAVLVFVGRVADEKNIGFLLDVVAHLRHRLSEVLLLIAGEGPASDRLRRRVVRDGLQDHVWFAGYLSRRGELQDCYRAGDVFVFASRTETQGLVLLEAMALGVPVVSTAVMGTRDVLVEGRGALIAREDVGDFSDRVALLLRDEPLRERLGESARAYAREWSAGAMAERMVSFYRAVTTGKLPPTGR